MISGTYSWRLIDVIHPSVPGSLEVPEYLVDESLKFSVEIEESSARSKPVWLTVMDDDSVLFSCPMSPAAAIRIGNQLRSAGARAELMRGSDDA
jgi:hypothetical protein